MDILTSLGVTWQELVTQAIGFIILIFLLNKWLTKPVLKVLDDRQADIKATYDQLDADREAMHRTRAEYEKRLADIESQAREKIAAAVKEAQELRANIIADAQKLADATLEKGRADAERETQRAFTEMRQQIVDLAILGAGKVINEALDASRHQKLVDDLISSVGPAQVAAAGKRSSNGAGPNSPTGSA